MKRMSLLFSGIVVMLLITNAVSAQSNLPGGGWWSGEQIMNVGTEEATIIITAYDMSSPPNEYEIQESLAAGAAITKIPVDFPGMPSGFQGSAVVSADQPIKAIVNITNRHVPLLDLGIADGVAAAQYQGIDGSVTDTTLYFPMAKGNHYDKTTTFYIQNAGDGDTTANADFVMRNGDTWTYTTPTIGPNQMIVFSVYDAANGTPYDPTVENDGRIGGMTLNSNTTQPLAGVIMEHFTTENPATVIQGTRGLTAADFDTKAYAPITKHDRFGRFTGIQVQNVSTDTIDVTVTYQGSGGACAGNTYVDTHTGIPAGEAHTFVQWEGRTNLIPNCTASATIEATGGKLVAIVNEATRFDRIGTYGDAGIMYSALAEKSATTKVSAPQYKDNRYGNTTGLQIQNVGQAQATNIVATFVCQGANDFTAISSPQTVDVGGAVLFFTPSDDTGMFTVGNPFVSDNVNCAVMVTSDQPIVANVNEMGWAGLVADDNNYEGFNLVPPPP